MEPIAIIGIGCRFPNANNPQAFWNLLRNGIDTITEIPSSRWDIDTFYHPEAATPGKINTRWGGFLEQVDRFEPSFFGISPREAQQIDPQQRLLLEVSWEALENAQIVPVSLAGSQTGVFIGISNVDYHRLVYKDLLQIEAYSGTGTASSIASNRLSYLLDLRGPSLAIDTACSSSLVALHYACGSLHSGESNLCLVGGVNLILSPEPTITFSQAHMMAADGRCKTFDANADGYVRGEGCGVVVLKRLSDAIRDEDNIQAVIRGSAVNQDGLTNGITAPNGPSQQAVVRKALEKAGVKPAQISYVETHGTGTSLGDPIEVNSLKNVLMEDREPNQTCWIGSVKTNIGHLESAAGIAGLIKVVLSLQNEEIPPLLHFKELNPYIKIKNTPIKIPTSFQKWLKSEKPRLAGISSFGFGGTNTHVIVEEAPQKVKTNNAFGELPCHILTLSAKCEKALQELVQRYEEFLSHNSTIKIADLCFTANTGRSHFNYRLALVAESTEELREQLKAFETQEDIRGVVSGQLSSKKRPKIAFLFTGQGCQYVNMARELYSTQPIFHKALEECNAILSLYSDKSLLNILYPQSGNSMIDETIYTQPALFAIEYALAQLWKSWGIEPDVVMGHSVGEYVAATVAGVFCLEDGLKLVANRGRLMQELPPGGEMVAVMASESQVREVIEPYASKVAIAAINGPISTVISGAANAIRRICDKLESDGIKTKKLQVSHAFHSPLMESMLAEFESIASEITYNQPSIPIISNLTGEQATVDISTPQYWVNHVRQPVRFSAGIKTLEQIGYKLFLEIGPKPILSVMGRQCVPKDRAVWLPSLRPGYEEWQQMLQSLAELYVRGVEVDWSGLDTNYFRSKVVLPTYPFQRKRYWLEEAKLKSSRQNKISNKPYHPLLGQQINSPAIKEIFFESQFSLNSLPFLKDHLVYGTVVVPGANHVSMVLSAAAKIFGSGVKVIRDVLIHEAFVLGENDVRSVQLILKPENPDNFAFQIFSVEEGVEEQQTAWKLHATGKVHRDNTNAAVSGEELSLIAVQARCQEELSPQAYYQKIREIGLDLGISFQGISQIWRRNGEALAKIKLPDVLNIESDAYEIHPAFLDACFQLVGVCISNQGVNSTNDIYVPVHIGEVKLYGRPGHTVWCHSICEIKEQLNKETFSGNLRVFDENGQIVAEVFGLVIKRAPREALLYATKKHLNDWLYEVEWQPQNRLHPIVGALASDYIPQSLENKAISPTKQGYWLIFADRGGVAQQLGEQLQLQNEKSIFIYPGTSYDSLETGVFTIDPAQPEHFQKLCQTTLGADDFLCRGIIHLWSLESPSAKNLTNESLKSSQILSCGSVLYLVQAIVGVSRSKLPRLWLVTQDAQTVQSSSAVVMGVAQASLWGLGRVLAKEHSQLWGGLLDLDAQASVQDMASLLLAEILNPDREDHLAFREGQRYVARLVRHRQSDILTENLHFQSDASYLITGGLGGVGLKVAQWMVERGARHLVLVGRSGASATAKEVLKGLEYSGTQIVVEQADVSQEEQVLRVLNDISKSMPPLRGVIHGAGVLDDGVLLQQDWQRFTKVLAPKVDGAWNLHKHTLNQPLDFFVLFSSVAALFGSPAQANYAAANAFLDALAQYRLAAGLPGLSINWGIWDEVGVAAKRKVGERMAIQGIGSIKPEQGLQILEQLFHNSSAQVGVMPINWQQWRKSQSQVDNTPLLAQLIEEETEFQLQHEQQGKGSLTNAALLRAEPQERRQLLEFYLHEQVARILRMPASKLDVQQPLSNLGLDSLMGIELKNQVENNLELLIPMTKLLEGPSIAQLAEELLQQSATKDVTSVVVDVKEKTANANQINANNWIIKNQLNNDVRLRLFCLHYLGGGASAFRQWSDNFPPEIEICPIQLPGRENRINEQPFEDIESLVEKLTQILYPYLDKPFAFYGHSMGALVSFELARQLRRQHGLIPVHLFAAAYYAPDAISPFQKISYMEESSLISSLPRLLDAPESLLKNTEFIQALLPTVKADLQIVGKHIYSDEEPLDCPISAFGGLQDKEVSYDDLSEWGKHTKSKFNLQMFPGKHLFLLSDREIVSQSIVKELMPVLV